MHCLIMAPHGEAIPSSFPRGRNLAKPPRLSSSGIQRTKSDISYAFSKEAAGETQKLPPVSEVEDANCECCGMSEECTPEYIDRVRKKFSGKWICGLCAEAVKEEAEKNGGDKEEALDAHTNACVKFNKMSRIYPVLFQAEAMREILKKSRLEGGGTRAKSISPRDKSCQKKGGIARSSSCIPAITREISDLKLAN